MREGRETVAPAEVRTSSGASENSMLVYAAGAQAAVSFIVLGLPAIGPQLRSAFSLSLPAVGALLAIMQFGSGVALISAGRAVDRWGSRVAARGGTALATAGLLLGALAPSITEVFIGLFLAGLGAAIVPVAGAGAIFRTYPPQRRAWALGVRQMAVPFGGVVAAATVPGLDAIGGVRLVLAAGAVAMSVMGAAFASVSDDVSIQHDRSVRIVRGIWHGPGLRRLVVVIVTYVFVLQAVLIYTVPAMHAEGFSAFETGLGYFLLNATAMLSRWMWGRIADRDGGTRRRRSLVETGLMASTGAILFGAALHGALIFVLPAVMFVAFAALGWNAVLYALAGEWTRPELAGRAFAVTATLVFVSSSLANPVIGAIADAAGWNALWGITAAIGLLGTLAAWQLPDRGPHPAGSPPGL